MTTTLAFDVYGTLIDTNGVLSELRKRLPENAEAFSAMWREKQLEYSFRRGLMQNYASFAVCTRDALEYTCAVFKTSLNDDDKQALMDSYKALPAFGDVENALDRLKAAGHRMFAFSNGREDAVEELLASAGIRHFFEGVVSVDDLRSYKPNPAVYSHFLRRSGASGNGAWLVSSNPFDVIGAVSAGWRAAWVRRSESVVFDPWGIEPTVTIRGLGELEEKISG